jgi:hypothetical protein
MKVLGTVSVVLLDSVVVFETPLLDSLIESVNRYGTLQEGQEDRFCR